MWRVQRLRAVAISLWVLSGLLYHVMGFQMTPPSIRAGQVSTRPSILQRSLWPRAIAQSKTAPIPSVDSIRQAILKEQLLVRKTLEYGRGGTTVNNYLAFIKKGTEKLKPEGITLQQVVDVLSSILPDDGKRKALLEAYRQDLRQKSASTISRFSSTGSGSHSGAEIVGPNYVISPLSTKVSSGKSVVVDGKRVGGKGQGPLKIKLSRDTASITREWENLCLLRERGGIKAKDSIVQTFDFLENYDRRGSHALVMEAGETDLTRYIMKRGRLTIPEIRSFGKTLLDVLSSLEAAKLVWTDLRSQNFIVMGNGRRIKAIDLESAVRSGEKPVDCSLEVTPPEISGLYASSQIGQAVATPAYDVWSFGILLYTMATGNDFLSGKNDLSLRAMQRAAVVTPSYRLTQAAIEERVRKDVADPALAGVILRILRLDPTQRPSASELRRDWFFLRPF